MITLIFAKLIMLNLYSVGIKNGTQFVLKILFKAVFICGNAGSGKKKEKINCSCIICKVINSLLYSN